MGGIIFFVGTGRGLFLQKNKIPELQYKTESFLKFGKTEMQLLYTMLISFKKRLLEERKNKRIYSSDWLAGHTGLELDKGMTRRIEAVTKMKEKEHVFGMLDTFNATTKMQEFLTK